MQKIQNINRVAKWARAQVQRHRTTFKTRTNAESLYWGYGECNDALGIFSGYVDVTGGAM